MILQKAMGALSLAALLLLGALFLPRLVLGDSEAFASILTPAAVVFVTAPLKVLFLSLAAYFATRSFASFESANPARRAWLLLAVGLWGYGAAQSVLAYHQLVLDRPTPFPSIADVLFVPATLLIAVSLYAFVGVYAKAGFRVGTSRDLAGVALGALLLLAAFFAVVGRPVLASEAPLAERLLNLTYPILDVLLLVPAVLLLRMALAMRGGALWKVWMGLVVGLVFLAAGDILFAVFTTLGHSALDPLLDLMFAWSYVLIAHAAATQYGILSA